MSGGSSGARNVDPKLRDAALEAAKRHNLQISGWLADATRADEPMLAANETGYVAPAPFEALTQRLDVVESRNQMALAGLDRQILGLAGRIESTETGAREEALRLLAALGDLKSAQDEARTRISALESPEAQARVTSALRALDRQLAKLSQQVFAIDARTSSQDGSARDAVEALRREIEARLAEAEAKLAAAEGRVESAVGAATGDIKDQMAELDLALRSDVRAAVSGAEAKADTAARAAAQIEARIGEVSQSMRGEMGRALAAAESRHGLLEQQFRDSLNALTDRLGAAEAASAEAEEKLQAIDASIGAALQVVDKKIEAGGAQGLRRMEERLANLDLQTGRALREIEASVQGFSDRLDAQERVTPGALQALEGRFGALDQKVAALAAIEPAAPGLGLADLDDRIGALRTEMAAQLEAARSQFAAQLAAALASSKPADLEASLAEVTSRMDAAERRQSQTVEAVSIEIKRLSEAVDRRLRLVEAAGAQSQAAPEIAKARAELAALAGQLQQRQDQMAQRETESRARFDQEAARLAQRIDERLAAAERQTGDAIQQLGRQISDTAERASQRQDQTARDLAAQMEALDTRTAARLQDVLTALGQRIGDVDARAENALTPLQNGMQTLASRLQSLEDARAPEPPIAPMGSLGDIGPLDELPPFDDGVSPRTGMLADQDPLTDLALPESTDTADLWGVEPDPEVEKPPVAPAPAPKPQRQVRFGGADAAPLDPLFEDAAPPPEPEGSKKGQKGDYLAAARRAAQEAASKPAAEAAVPSKPQTRQSASSAISSGRAAAENAINSLRGKRMVMMAGFGGLATVAIAGAAFVLSQNLEKSANPAPEAAPSAEPGAAAANDSELMRAGPAPTPSLQTLEEAAASGDKFALYELGAERMGAGDAALGVNLMRRAAEQGVAVAQYRLAKAYEKGGGVRQDLAEARRWTERAAAAGNRSAMHDLGVFFARGEGAPQDGASAFKWFRQAAELGVADSQFNLGVLYQQGSGTPVNLQEAMFWFLVAGKGGDKDAAARAEVIRKDLPAAQAANVAARAEAFTPKPFNAEANGQIPRRIWAGAPAQ